MHPFMLMLQADCIMCVIFFDQSSLTINCASYLIFQIMNIPEKSYIAVQKLVPGRTIRKRVVGIFSREAEDFYHFLLEALRFHDEVRTFTITNNGGSRFRDEVSQCDFAILYHSKNRGRLNITDVTDSIYDEELKHLSKTLGETRVLLFLRLLLGGFLEV